MLYAGHSTVPYVRNTLDKHSPFPFCKLPPARSNLDRIALPNEHRRDANDPQRTFSAELYLRGES